MTQNNQQALYDRYLSGHFAEVSHQGRYRERKLAYYAHNYAAHLPANRAAALLDIGPGFGELLELLKRSGYRNIHAVDLSPEVAAYCNRIVPNSTVVVDDTTAYLRNHAAHFDAITLFHILEHVPKQAILPLLTAARAALRPGGRLIVEVPNMANPVIGLNVRYADFTHEVGFTELSLRHVLTTAGFGQVRLFETQLTPDRWERPFQRLAQVLFHSGVKLVYRAYGQRAPQLLGRSVSAIAEQ
jgi:2-polyprenyl-3-methyl-5-hydroxy-6-metoxy-1,4-benzoquinol methylase